MIRYKVARLNRSNDDKEIASNVDQSIGRFIHHNINASQSSSIHRNMIRNQPKLDWLKCDFSMGHIPISKDTEKNIWWNYTVLIANIEGTFYDGTSVCGILVQNLRNLRHCLFHKEFDDQ